MKIIPVSENNVDRLYSLVSNEVYRNFCGERIKECEDFKKQVLFFLKTGIRRKQVLLELNKNLVGTIYSYYYNSLDGVVYVTIYIHEDAYGNGIKFIAKYLTELFQDLSLHKVYFHVYSFNQRCLKIINKLNIPQEGCLLNHRVFDNSRFDLYIYGLTQKLFTELCEKYRLA